MIIGSAIADPFGEFKIQNSKFKMKMQLILNCLIKDTSPSLQGGKNPKNWKPFRLLVTPYFKPVPLGMGS